MTTVRRLNTSVELSGRDETKTSGNARRKLIIVLLIIGVER
jgi:hypothetical protein